MCQERGSFLQSEDSDFPTRNAQCKTKFKKGNLEYKVTMGIVNVIKIPWVTQEFKHDDTLEKITVEHLKAENDWVSVFLSKDLFESAFSLRLLTLDEIMLGQTKKI